MTVSRLYECSHGLKLGVSSYRFLDDIFTLDDDKDKAESIPWCVVSSGCPQRLLLTGPQPSRGRTWHERMHRATEVIGSRINITGELVRF